MIIIKATTPDVRINLMPWKGDDNVVMKCQLRATFKMFAAASSQMMLVHIANYGIRNKIHMCSCMTECSVHTKHFFEGKIWNKWVWCRKMIQLFHCYIRWFFVSRSHCQFVESFKINYVELQLASAVNFFLGNLFSTPSYAALNHPPKTVIALICVIKLQFGYPDVLDVPCTQKKNMEINGLLLSKPVGLIGKSLRDKISLE